ncbi:hypothetical protein [Mycobacterium sp. 141]|uniref:DUF7159 family protein n=1 Tax=Mycobacterium sp. 141 TaxID=1120797 RepID=UPI00036E23C0|nr:hypothetical protein [Mycobacterium sp. 141]
MRVDAVLGVSMTAASVGLVLVKGRNGDGATLAHDTIDLRAYDESDVCDEVVSAVAHLGQTAARSGHTLRSVGVTWSDYAEREAAEVVNSLSESGFGRTGPIRLPQATEALARGIADAVGFDTTVICVIEPEMVVALTVRPGAGPVRSTVNHLVDSHETLSGWLHQVFAAADERPDALVVVGSAGDLSAVMPKLERALGVPVFTPAEAKLALARGAALVAARRGRFMFDDETPERRKRWTSATLAPIAMLAGGVVTFVVSISLAVSMQLIPHRQPATTGVPPAPSAQLVEPASVDPPAQQPPTPESAVEPGADQSPAAVPASEEVPAAAPVAPPPAEVPSDQPAGEIPDQAGMSAGDQPPDLAPVLTP